MVAPGTAVAVIVALVGLLGRDDPGGLDPTAHDGERTAGRDLAAFRAFHASLSVAQRQVPVFSVLIGEGERRRTVHRVQADRVG